MKKQKENKQKGITLIALIITVIVMLILVGVSVSVALNGGLFKTAKQAAEQTKLAIQEESGLKYEYEIAKATGKVKGSGSYKEYLLEKEYEEAKNAGTYEGTYIEYVSSKYGLGDAINTENYGKKVVGYKSKGEGLDTLVWRVFYQDDKNTYLISETSDTKIPVSKFSFYTSTHNNVYVYTYTKKDIVEKYNSGADVSIYGQALMSKASSLFTTDNENENIIATAYLCDPEVWDEYTDAEGKASYAIGSPTIELFAESYNASNLGNTITLGTNANGYTENTRSNWFTTSQKNGIYNLTGSDYWWLSSPEAGGPLSVNSVTESMHYLNKFGVNSVSDYGGARPVVSIPTPDFQSSYTLSD